MRKVRDIQSLKDAKIFNFDGVYINTIKEENSDVVHVHYSNSCRKAKSIENGTLNETYSFHEVNTPFGSNFCKKCLKSSELALSLKDVNLRVITTVARLDALRKFYIEELSNAKKRNHGSMSEKLRAFLYLRKGISSIMQKDVKEITKCLPHTVEHVLGWDKDYANEILNNTNLFEELQGSKNSAEILDAFSEMTVKCNERLESEPPGRMKYVEQFTEATNKEPLKFLADLPMGSIPSGDRFTYKAIKEIYGVGCKNLVAVPTEVLNFLISSIFSSWFDVAPPSYLFTEINNLDDETLEIIDSIYSLDECESYYSLSAAYQAALKV